MQILTYMCPNCEKQFNIFSNEPALRQCPDCKHNKMKPKSIRPATQGDLDLREINSTNLNLVFISDGLKILTENYKDFTCYYWGSK